MSPGTLLIRADASIEMGTGHVMRCLALAQAWQDTGGDVIFCQAQSTPSLDERLRLAGIGLVHLEAPVGTLQDATRTAEIARVRNAQWVVVDGYNFDVTYRERLKQNGVKVLFVDDIGCCETSFADIVLNPNINVNGTLRAQCGGELLLGPQHILLRREFSTWREWKRDPVPVVCKILVTMGGSDPYNVTETVIRALSSLEDLDLEVIVIVGRDNPHMDSLLKAKSQFANIELRRDVSGMGELMAWADLAISAGGGTCYELIFFQVPTILITVAENQRKICQSLREARVAMDAGWFHALDTQRLAEWVRALILDSGLREILIENCRHLVDGKGADRVVKSMLSKARILAGKMPA
jgi:UDP-2,4-diacetamido-2,4,6-trideoxy-beta-L-altropyranose hydrolase